MEAAGRASLAQAQTVGAFLVDVQFEMHALGPERGREGERVFNFHGLVLPGVPDKTRRRISGHLLLAREVMDQFGRWRRPQQIQAAAAMGILLHRDDRIAQDAQVGP
jgi:hypothetical protein